MMRLDEQPPGAALRVQCIHGTGLLAQRLAEMGLIPGTRIDVIRYAPLGDPMEVEVEGYFLSIRRSDAATVEVIPFER